MTEAKLEVSRPRPLGDGRFLFAVLDDRGTALATVICPDKRACEARIADLRYLLAVEQVDAGTLDWVA
jgi:hypothetical protein